LTGKRLARASWIRAWGPVAVWVGVIFALSSDTFSAPSTSGILGPLLEWLLPDASADTIYRLHVAIRKGAHLGVYAVLALLALRAGRLGHGWALAHAAALSLVCVASVASLDELHQVYARSRTGSLRDVGIDLVGGAAALGLALAAAGLRRALRGGAPVEAGP
jgi:VanZ family protein